MHALPDIFRYDRAEPFNVEAVMAKKKPSRKNAFRREALVKTLKAQGNHRWREAACKDLIELKEHNGGVDHLAAAIKAVLRSDKWRKKND